MSLSKEIQYFGQPMFLYFNHTSSSLVSLGHIRMISCGSYGRGQIRVGLKDFYFKRETFSWLSSLLNNWGWHQCYK